MTLNQQDCIATELKYTKKPKFGLLFLHLAHFRVWKSLPLWTPFKTIKKIFAQVSHSCNKKEKTLTAIDTFELAYFYCDLQIAMRDEGAGRDISDESPPIPSLKQWIVAYKPIK